MKPTRIIRKLEGKGRNNIPIYVYECDNGQTYTAEELAQVCGMAKATLYRWLRESNFSEIRLDKKIRKSHAKKPVATSRHV